MKIKSCEKTEKSEYQIIVEVSPEEFESAVNKSFMKNKKSISVPGFRKGKASRRIVERMYGDDVFHPDALDFLLPEVMDFADKETDLNTVGYPQVSDVDIREDKTGVDITIIAAVYPEVTLGEYKGLSAVKPSSEVPDSAVDAEVASIQMRNARTEKADRAAVEGDITVIDFDGYVDGEQFDGGKAEGYELELGSKAFIPGFEDQVIGMSPGEQRDINLVFPEAYTPELAGKPVVFKVKLHEIKERLLPELDDEFAKDVSEFDTLDEYKADIRARLEKTSAADADVAFENALMEKVIENLEASVPDAMVEEQMDMGMQNFARQIQSYGMEPAQYLQMMNVTPEIFRENMRSNCEKQVKIMLALEKIAELEGIVVGAEEIEKEYAEAAERFGVEVDKIKESVPEEKVSQDIKARLAAKVVTESATATEPPAKEDEPEASGEKAEKSAPKAKKPAAKKTATEKKEPTEKAAAEKKEPAAKKESAAKSAAAKKEPAEKKESAAKKEPAAKKAPARKKAEEKPAQDAE